MNITTSPIVEQVLPLLSTNLKASVRWEANSIPKFDGRLILKRGDQVLSFSSMIKSLLPNAYIPKLEQENLKQRPIFLLAELLYPKQRKKLQELAINYADTQGNIFIDTKDFFVLIDRPGKAINKPTGNRAFTKTGLKVLFQLLLDKELINRPQREIAQKSKVALGNIPKVINGLLNTGYLLDLDGKKYLWQDREGLLAKWIQLYELTLLPLLDRGSYRLQKGDWRDLELNPLEGKWGGEAAGEMLSNYLQTEELILYTKAARSTLMKEYHLLPDPKGSIRVRDLFWEPEEESTTVPALLVYADLVLSNNQRSLDTAQIIYDTYVEKIL